jgi:hypothetical protein
MGAAFKDNPPSFSDGLFSSRGYMSITTAMRTSVSQLYVAMFGRAPDSTGLNYWAGLLDGGQSMTQVADAMFGVTPARAYFPSGLSNEQIIASFYSNVLGRTADATGLAFWTAKLNAAGATPGSVITEMIDVIAHYAGSDPAGVASAGLFNNRAEAAQFYGEHGGSLANASSVLSGVSASDSTVLAAQVLFKQYGSGEVDAGGYSDITIGSLTNDVELTNVMDGATLRVNFGSMDHTIDVRLFDPSGTADDLRVYLPTDTYNWLHLQFDGLEHLDLVAPSTGWHGELVYLGNSELETVAVTGHAALDLYEVDAGLVDSSGFTGPYLTFHMQPGNLLVGSSGADELWAFGTGGTVNGAAGDDELYGRGQVTLIGGAGQDEFSFGLPDTGYVTIGDFQKGSDIVRLWPLVTNYKPGTSTTSSDYGTWYSQGISLGASATFEAYLDAAAAPKQPAKTYATVSWFRYGNDAYLVIDNSASQATFQDGVDQVIKFTGFTDLSSFTYNSFSALFS